MNVVQVYESGEGLEEIPFNLSHSITHQISAGNERIEGLSENEKISCNLHSSLTVFEVERDFEKNSIQSRQSRSSEKIYIQIIHRMRG